MNAKAAYVVIALVAGVICVNAQGVSQAERKALREYTPPQELVSIAPTTPLDKALMAISEVSKKFTNNRYVVDSTTEIGPKVGGRLRVDAAQAVAMATLGILIYIAIRFKFDFAVGATVATFHDALAVLAVFFLLGKEINLILITALLTIAGYSLTDTVVVFDRIRENLRTRLKEPVEAVMNASINEVLSRTVVTSFTVLLTSLALFFFGGEVLHDFSLAMILGVIFGTYSTIFVASPIALFWERMGFFKKRK